MSKTHKSAYVLIAAIIVTALVVGGVTYALTYKAPVTTTTKPETALTIYDWWTAGGEHAAIEAMIQGFETKYNTVAGYSHNITVVEEAIGGGAGTIMQSVVKPLVLAGEAPDSFQCHAGYEAYPYYTGGYLENINSVWTNNSLTKYIPAVVAQMCEFGGNYYAVPVDIHRVNLIWYNLTILDANHINPATLTTWSAFFAACKQLENNATLNVNGFSPIADGDSGIWASQMVFEDMMAGTGIASSGIPFYQDFINGKVTSATNTTLLALLGNFTTYMTYVNSNHAALTWDQAIARLMAGSSVFSLMGDWANGQWTVLNNPAIQFGVNYGAMPSPGSKGEYGLCVDCFQHPTGTADPTNSLLWCSYVASKQGQDEFNPLKGSIAARNDSDQSLYGAYQKDMAFPEFDNATYMFPSFTHGSGLPPPVLTDVNSAMSLLVTNPTPTGISTAASSITSSMVTNAAQFTTVWHLY